MATELPPDVVRLLAPLVEHPDRAAVITDFDGTLAPIVARSGRGPTHRRRRRGPGPPGQRFRRGGGDLGPAGPSSLDRVRRPATGAATRWPLVRSPGRALRSRMGRRDGEVTVSPGRNVGGRSSTRHRPFACRRSAGCRGRAQGAGRDRPLAPGARVGRVTSAGARPRRPAPACALPGAACRSSSGRPPTPTRARSCAPWRPAVPPLATWATTSATSPRSPPWPIWPGPAAWPRRRSPPWTRRAHPRWPRRPTWRCAGPAGALAALRWLADAVPEAGRS